VLRQTSYWGKSKDENCGEEGKYAHRSNMDTRKFKMAMTSD
jgi:hypothetical protein